MNVSVRALATGQQPKSIDLKAGKIDFYSTRDVFASQVAQQQPQIKQGWTVQAQLTRQGSST